MSSSHANEQAWVWLARIRKVQGRKGEVLADLLTDFPEKFSERKRVWLLSAAGSSGESAREIALENSWLHKAGHTSDVVLHFAGVDSIEEAEKLYHQVKLPIYAIGPGRVRVVPISTPAPAPQEEDVQST